MRIHLSGWRSGRAKLAPAGWGLASREGGFLTLIGLLVVIAIIAILFAMYGMPVGGTGGSSSSSPATIAGGAKQRAQGVLCQNDLQQLRAAIAIYQGNNQAFPPSLESLNAGVPLSCPVGGEPYEYDPTTGQVHCVHPGHERY
ncbi:MAG: type II secretion system protein [Armatimonadota bacterium]